MSRKWQAIVMGLLMTVGIFYPRETPGQEKTLFFLDWIIYGKHAPFFAAQDKGFFKKYGLEVEFQRGFGSGDTIKRVAVKAAPIGFADASSLVNARAAGEVPVKEVAMIHSKSIMVVGFLKEKAYKTPKDLAGVRIGTPKGNAAAVVFPALAGAHGVDLKSIQWIDMDAPSVTPSLLAGRIDVGLFFATELPTVRAAAGKIGREIGLFYYGDWGVDTYNNGLIVHEDTMKSNPKFVQNAVRAVLEAWGWSLIHVDEAVKNFVRYVPEMSEPIVRGHLQVAFEHLFDDGARQHGMGYMGHQKMDYTVELLIKLQNLKRRIPTEDIYTNQFLPQWPAIKAALGDKAR